MRTQQQQQQQQQQHQQQHQQQQQPSPLQYQQQTYLQQYAPSSVLNSKALGMESQGNIIDHHLNTFDVRPPAPLLTTKNQIPIDQLNKGHFVSQDNHLGNLALPTGLVSSRRIKEREDLPTFQKPVAKAPAPGLTVRELKELTRLRLQQSQKSNNSNFNMEERLSGGETSVESDIQSISTNMLSRSGTSTPDTDSLFDDCELSANNIHGYPYASMLGASSDFRTIGHVGHTPSTLPKSATIPPGLGLKNHIGNDMPLSYNNDIGTGMLRQSVFNNPLDDLSSLMNDNAQNNIGGLLDSFNDMHMKQSVNQSFIPNASISSQMKPQNNNILRKQAISNAFRESPYIEDAGNSLPKIFGNEPFSIGGSHFPGPLIAPPFRARANSQTSVDSPPGSPKTLRNLQQAPSNISCPEAVRKRTSSDCSLSLDIAEKMALSVIDATSSPIIGNKGKPERMGSFDYNLSDSNFLGKNISNDFTADLYR